MNEEKIKIFNLFTKIMDDRKELDPLDFFKYFDFIPYDETYHDKVLEEIEKYFGKNSAIYRIIKKYMNDNYIDDIKPINYDKLYDQEFYMNNQIVTNETVDKVLEIIDLMNYPKINYVFGKVLVKCLNNEIDIEKLRSKIEIRKKLTLYK